MKIKFNIQQKIQFYILSAVFVIFTIAIGFVGIKSKQKYLKNAILLSEEIAEKNALKVQEKLESDLTIPRTLANSVKEYKRYSQEEWKSLFSQMYINVLKANPQIDAIWDTWELKVIDSTWTKPYGRYTYICWWDNGEIEENVNFFYGEDSPQYTRLKSAATENVDEPYFYSYNNQDSVLLTDLVAPIKENGEWIGLVAIDFNLNKFQEIVSQIKPFDNSFAFLISNEGNIIGHHLKDQLGKNVGDVYPKISKDQKLLKKIKSGKSISFTSEIDGDDNSFIFRPIQIGNSGAPWSLALVVPAKEIQAESNKILYISLLAGVIGLALLSLIIWFLSNNITAPIRKITSLLTHLSTGEISSKMKVEVKSGDEIAEMAAHLNNHIDALNSKAEFAEDIGKANYSVSFTSLGEEDVLGNALAEMKENLHNAEIQEKQRIEEDKKRRWANEGIAEFAEILRQNNSNLELLGFNIIQNLVNYLNANQGGIFLLDDNTDDVFIGLLAAYAYDRRKFLQKRIELGEGLIGRCVQEKQTIYMTDLPPDYMEITSGLGFANPDSLLIVPLRMEEKVLGVVEIASFNKFEKFEIEFVEKVAESIASTLNSVRINVQTSLLLEKSQQQSEEMSAQEEEMRQNLEELQATQEESTRKSAEMTGLIDALNKSSYVIEYDINGYITEINNMYLDLLGLKREEVIGTHHSDNIEFTPDQKKKYDDFWVDLKRGMIKKETSTISINNRTFIFSETYSPIKDINGDIVKVLKISNNITDLMAENQ